MSFEANEVFYTFQGQAIDNNGPDAEPLDKMSPEEALRKFVKFIREWNNDGKHIYRYVLKFDLD